jgi:RNA polymerase primary sigma factor
VSSARQAAAKTTKPSSRKTTSSPSSGRGKGKTGEPTVAVVPDPEAAAPADPAALVPSGSAGLDLPDAAEPDAAELVEEEDEEEEVVVPEEDTSGPSTDLVRAYLKEIGRVALLNAEQEVELAKRIEAGLFAAEKLRQADAGETKLTKTVRKDLEWLAADGQRAKDHLL